MVLFISLFKNRLKYRYEIVIITALILICMAITYYCNFILKTDIVFSQFFYVPIILAGFWWGYKALWVSFILGSWMMGSVFLSLHTGLTPNVLRFTLFITIGVIAGKFKELIETNRQLLWASNQQLAASNQQLAASNQQLSLSEQQLRAAFRQLVANEKQLRVSNYNLNKRIKEIECLRNISVAAWKKKMSLDDMFREVVNITPSGLQYPDIACAGINYGGMEYRTSNFKETNWKLSANISISNDIKEKGVIEVFYLSEKPNAYVWPFLKEEKMLINTIAMELEASIRSVSEAKDKDKMQAQLFHSQKMESIGILAGGIAHDFNNILTAIRGYAELAKSDTDNKDILIKDLDEIYSAAKRASELVSGLLMFSRKQPISSTAENINNVINGMLKMLKQIIGTNIRVKIDLAVDLRKANIDAAKIEQVILNLMVNARDAMPKGGVLIVKTENTDISGEDSKLIYGSLPGRYICISVKDNGIGMDDKTIENIFDPFFSTKDSGKGTGLGLSVVYGIVKQHNGWINVYSKPGQGTEFKIYLPLDTEKGKNR